MALVKASEIYSRARAGRYAIGGFCAENLEMIQAILEAAEECTSPVVVMLWQEDIRAAGPGYLEAIVRFGAERVKVPVAMMVDHAESLEFCVSCIADGHSAVMFDASHSDYEENIRLTRAVSDLAHEGGVLVEGELGTIKRGFEETGPFASEMKPTDPAMVHDYVRRSGIDCLAVSIGTESGITEEPPVIDFERLRAISKETDAYLTVHGGSGVDDQSIRRLVDSGMAAMRFASALRIAYLDEIERSRRELGSSYPDTRKIYGAAKEKVRSEVALYMQSLGSVGHAADF